MSCKIRVRFMVFKATFNNITFISWRSVLLVEEYTLYHIMLYRVHLVCAGFETHYTSSCKSNYHTTTTTTAPGTL